MRRHEYFTAAPNSLGVIRIEATDIKEATEIASNFVPDPVVHPWRDYDREEYPDGIIQHLRKK